MLLLVNTSLNIFFKKSFNTFFFAFYNALF